MPFRHRGPQPSFRHLRLTPGSPHNRRLYCSCLTKSLHQMMTTMSRLCFSGPFTSLFSPASGRAEFIFLILNVKLKHSVECSSSIFASLIREETFQAGSSYCSPVLRGAARRAEGFFLPKFHTRQGELDHRRRPRFARPSRPPRADSACPSGLDDLRLVSRFPAATLRTRGMRWVSGSCRSQTSPLGSAPAALK